MLIKSNFQVFLLADKKVFRNIFHLSKQNSVSESEIGFERKYIFGFMFYYKYNTNVFRLKRLVIQNKISHFHFFFIKVGPLPNFVLVYEVILTITIIIHLILLITNLKKLERSFDKKWLN